MAELLEVLGEIIAPLFAKSPETRQNHPAWLGVACVAIVAGCAVYIWVLV